MLFFGMRVTAPCAFYIRPRGIRGRNFLIRTNVLEHTLNLYRTFNQLITHSHMLCEESPHAGF